MAARNTSFPTPLVRLARFAPQAVLYVKAEHLQPSGSVFDRIAAGVVAANANELAARGVGVVGGCGSTCLAFATAAARSKSELVVVCPATTLPEHRKLLEGHRVTVVLSDGGAGLTGAHARAVEERERRGGVLLHTPIENAEAARLFESSVGAELVEDLPELAPRGEAVELVVPMGLGALADGIARAFAGAGRAVSIVAVVRSREDEASKIDGLFSEVEASGLPGMVVTAVRDRAAYETRREVARSEGLLLGMSSAAAIHVARSRASAPDNVVRVALAIDAGDRYFSVDHHFAHLDSMRPGGSA